MPSPTEESSGRRIDTLLDIRIDCFNLSLASAGSPAAFHANSPIDCGDASPIQCDGSPMSLIDRSDNENNYSSLIRDLDTTPNNVSEDQALESARKLDFEPPIPPADKRVVVQDSLNTFRYFSRSTEEQETCFGSRELKSSSRKSNKDDKVAYSDPLSESVSAKTRETIDRGAEKVGITKIGDEFISWAEGEGLKETVEGATTKMKGALKESSALLTQAMAALTTNDSASQIPGIDFKESWDERTVKIKNTLDESSSKLRSTWQGSQLKASIEEHSAKLKPVLNENLAKFTESFQSISPDCICYSSPDKSMELEMESENGIEVTAPDDYGFGELVMDTSFTRIPSVSSGSVFSGSSKATTDPEKTTDLVSSMLKSTQSTKASQVQQVQCFQSLADTSLEDIDETPSDEEKEKDMSHNSSIEEEVTRDLRVSKPAKVDLTRKLRVVQNARRWNDAVQQLESKSSSTHSLPPRAPPPPPPPPTAINQEHYFACEFNEVQHSLVSRPLFLEMEEDPITPTASHEKKIQMQEAPNFYNDLENTTSSPQSALDI